jgi:hypothetical protein
MEVLVREVCLLYAAISEGQGSPLPELKIQYADFAVWQRRYLTGAVLERLLAYWKTQLGGKLPVLDLPTDYPRPSVPSYRGAAKLLSLSAELSHSLRGLSKQEGVTLFMTLLAAFKALLYKYTAQEDIIIGTAIANRNRAEVEPLIGFFVNMLPMRVDLSGDPVFKELLRRVKEVTLSGYAHQDLPFESLVKEIQPEGAAREMPLFNVAFGIQHAPGKGLRLKGIKIRPMPTEQGGARFDLTLWVMEGAEKLQVRWTYNKALFEEETVIQMHSHFETLLSNIVDRPDARLTTLEILSRSDTGLDHKEPDDQEGPDLRKLMSIKRRGTNLSIESI